MDRCESTRYLHALCGSGHLPQALGAIGWAAKLWFQSSSRSSAASSFLPFFCGSFPVLVGRMPSLRFFFGRGERLRCVAFVTDIAAYSGLWYCNPGLFRVLLLRGNSSSSVRTVYSLPSGTPHLTIRSSGPVRIGAVSSCPSWQGPFPQALGTIHPSP